MAKKRDDAYYRLVNEGGEGYRPDTPRSARSAFEIELDIKAVKAKLDRYSKSSDIMLNMAAAIGSPLQRQLSSLQSELASLKGAGGAPSPGGGGGGGASGGSSR